MKMRNALALLACALPAPALADPWHCDFTVECVAAGACTEAAHQVEVIAADHEGRLFLSTPLGDSPVTRLTEDGALPASYAGAGRNGLAELLTIGLDGTALFSLHIFDETARAASYFGTCEVLN